MKHHHNFSNWINCFIFLAIFFCLSTDSNSQSIDFCGELSPNEAYSTNPDSIVYDRFGNSYDRYITEEIYGSELTTSTMAGYFDLRFDIGNISPDLTEVIIDVFEDLSSLIEQRVNTTGCSQEIEPSPVVIIIQSANLDDGVLAAASPMYIGGSENPSCDEVNVNLVDLKINGGLPGKGLDGKIEINADISPYTWNINTASASSDEADVYSVIIHEALHLFGIASLIGSDGTSSDDYFTVWDQFFIQLPIMKEHRV